jgi:thiol-disulfide isomerase/thioredoxin
MKLATIASSLMVLGTLGTSAAVHAEVKVGDPYVELDAKSATGKKFRLKDMAGKWVLYTFGASWCEACKKELPAWDKLAPKFTGKVLFVAVNINNKPDEGKQFLDTLKLKHIFPVFMPDEDSPAMKAYDPAHMPSTFVIDPKGVVQWVEFGYDKGDEDKLAAKLTELTK